MFINNSGHMTKMDAMPKNGKNPSKFSSRHLRSLSEPIATTLDMQHLGLEYYNAIINHDPVMTLMGFTARST